MKRSYEQLEALLIQAMKENRAGYDPRNHVGGLVILQEIMKDNK